MKLRWLLLAALTATMHGQAIRFDSNVTQVSGNTPPGAAAPVYTVPNAIVTVCGYPAVGNPCTNTITVYQDQGETIPVAQPMTADGAGRFGFWAAPGNYTYSVQRANGSNVGTYTISFPSSAVVLATNFAGVDIGDSINNAYASLPATGGTILIPATAGCYVFTTPIVFNVAGKRPMLQGQGGGVCMKYTAASGTAITFNASGNIPHNPGWGMSSIQLVGVNNDLPPNAGNTAIGLLVGGSNGADGFHMDSVMVSGLATGITFGSNTFNISIEHTTFINSNQNLNWPNGLSNAGERIDFVSSTFANSTTSHNDDCVHVGDDAGVSFRFLGGNFDSCQLHVVGGTPSGNSGPVAVFGSWFENPAGAMTVPYVKNDAGLLTMFQPGFFADPGAPGVPIYANGPTAVYNPTAQGAFSGMIQDTGSFATLTGWTSESISSTIPIVNVDATIASPTSSYFGLLKQPNFFFTDATPGMGVCNGTGGSSSSCASFDRGVLWSALWSGTVNQYIPTGIQTLAQDLMGFCRADGFKPLGGFNDNHMDCTTNYLDFTAGLFNTKSGYAVGGKTMMQSASKTITADGTVVVATLAANNATYTGLFNIVWRPNAGGSANRNHALEVLVQFSPLSTPGTVSVIGNNSFTSGGDVITNPRLVTDGSGNYQLLVTIGNRNSVGNNDALQASLLGDAHGATTFFPATSAFGTAVTSTGFSRNSDGSYSFPALSGTGNALLCLTATGQIYRGTATTCP